MIKIVCYAIGFFLITLLFQYLLHGIRKNGNRGEGAIWVGRNAENAWKFGIKSNMIDIFPNMSYN